MLNPEQIEARRQLLHQEVREKRSRPDEFPRMAFWLSFCDTTKPSGQQFLGGCLIDNAVNFIDALDRSHRLGANPRNCEVMGSPPIDPKDIPDSFPRNRFVSKDELERLGPIETML